MTPAELPAVWRAEAERLRTRYASEQLASLAEAFALELEAALVAQQHEELSRAQAIEEFDVHPDHLTRLAREGKLPNRGRRHAPKYRRGDLAALGLRPRQNPVGTVAPKASVSSLDSFTRRVQGRGR